MDAIPEGTKSRSTFHDPNHAVNGRFDSTTVHQFQISSSPDSLKTVYRRQFSHIAGRAVLTKTYVDIPQGANFGEIYPLESAQFKGWYIKIDVDLVPLPLGSPSNLLVNLIQN